MLIVHCRNSCEALDLYACDCWQCTQVSSVYLVGHRNWRTGSSINEEQTGQQQRSQSELLASLHDSKLFFVPVPSTPLALKPYMLCMPNVLVLVYTLYNISYHRSCVFCARRWRSCALRWSTRSPSAGGRRCAGSRAPRACSSRSHSSAFPLRRRTTRTRTRTRRRIAAPQQAQTQGIHSITVFSSWPSMMLLVY